MTTRKIAIGIGIAIAVAVVVVFLLQHGITIRIPWIKKKPNVRYLTFRSGVHFFDISPNMTYVVHVTGPVYTIAGELNNTEYWRSHTIKLILNVSGTNCGTVIALFPYAGLYIHNFTGSIKILRIPLKHGVRICIWVNSKFIGCWNHTLIGVKAYPLTIIDSNNKIHNYCIVVLPNKTRIRIKCTRKEQEQNALIYNITFNGRLIGQLYLFFTFTRDSGVGIDYASNCVVKYRIIPLR